MKLLMRQIVLMIVLGYKILIDTKERVKAVQSKEKHLKDLDYARMRAEPKDNQN